MGRIVRGGRLLAVTLRSDRCRQASWLAAATSALALGVIATWSPASVRLPAALAIGGLAAVAAIGDPPRGIAGPGAAWIAGRTVWPALGGCCGVLLCSLLAGAVRAGGLPSPAGGGPGAAAAVLVFAVGGMIAVAVAFAHGLHREVAAADAGSLALVGVFTTAGVLAAVPDSSSVASGVMAVAVWVGMYAVAMVADRLFGGAGGEAEVATLLGRTAMVSTLAGMVFWLFLAPDEGARYTLLAVGWFAALALPQTALGCGSRDETTRQRLVATARPVAWRTAAFHAAVLGWPLVVAAVLADDETRALSRLSVVGLLAINAAMAAALTVAVLVAGGNRETALAAVLGLGCLAAAAAAATAAMGPKPAGNDVEQFAPSCKTPVSMPPDAALPPV